MPRLLAVAVVVALLAASAATLVPRWVRPRWQVGPEVPAIDPRARVLPDRTYDLRAWVFRWPEPPRQPPRDGAERPPAAAAQAWVAGVLEGFRREHANVRVTVEWLPLSAAPERLRTAVEEGAPPDVAVPPPGAVLLYQRGAQLPADPWLGRSEAEWYEPAAWRGLAAGGWHWGWPAWVAPRLWAVRGEALAAAGLDATAVRRGGWTAADVRRLLQASAAQPVVAVPDDGWDALLDLVAAGASLEQAAAWLVDLRGARRLLVAAAGPQGEGGLEAWRTGRAAMVAGPSPFLAAELARRGAELVPAPRLDSGGAASAAQPFIRADVGGVLVFRQKSYRGDDHTRAAVELARAFSRQSIPWADAAGPVYPAARQGRDERGRPLPSLPAWLAPHLRAGPLPTVEAAATAARRRQEQVGPALAAFWARRADPAELARALERLAAESR